MLHALFEEKVKELAKGPEHRNFSKVVKQHYTAPRENERYNKRGIRLLHESILSTK